MHTTERKRLNVRRFVSMLNKQAQVPLARISQNNQRMCKRAQDDVLTAPLYPWSEEETPLVDAPGEMLYDVANIKATNPVLDAVGRAYGSLTGKGEGIHGYAKRRVDIANQNARTVTQKADTPSKTDNYERAGVAADEENLGGDDTAEYQAAFYDALEEGKSESQAEMAAKRQLGELWWQQGQQREPDPLTDRQKQVMEREGFSEDMVRNLSDEDLQEFAQQHAQLDTRKEELEQVQSGPPPSTGDAAVERVKADASPPEGTVASGTTGDASTSTTASTGDAPTGEGAAVQQTKGESPRQPAQSTTQTSTDTGGSAAVQQAQAGGFTPSFDPLAGAGLTEAQRNERAYNRGVQEVGGQPVMAARPDTGGASAQANASGNQGASEEASGGKNEKAELPVWVQSYGEGLTGEKAERWKGYSQPQKRVAAYNNTANPRASRRALGQGATPGYPQFGGGNGRFASVGSNMGGGATDFITNDFDNQGMDATAVAATVGGGTNTGDMFNTDDYFNPWTNNKSLA